MNERPAWCVCAEGRCDYFCRCEPHHPSELEVTHVPFSLHVCPICGALVNDVWRWTDHPHFEWHERRGDLG